MKMGELRQMPISKLRAYEEFERDVMPGVRARDRPMVRQAWCEFVDRLHREGRITDRQACDWDAPPEREALKCETDTPEMEARVRAAATTYFDADPDQVFFEHGQWWVDFHPGALCDDERHTFSVVDAEGGRSTDGFDFEEV